MYVNTGKQHTTNSLFVNECQHGATILGLQVVLSSMKTITNNINGVDASFKQKSLSLCQSIQIVAELAYKVANKFLAINLYAKILAPIPCGSLESIESLLYCC